jgi:hypothetical protein
MKEETMSANDVTWATISSYFSPADVTHMKNVTGGSLDLSECESVQHWAKQIYVAVSNQVMPPGQPWTPDQIAAFKAWMDAGAKCPVAEDA